jgi:hypothetical protein
VTVQELRDTLSKLVELLQATDAKAATTRDLTEFVEATKPFGDLTLKAFVKLAEAGRAPKSADPPPTPKPRPGKAVQTDPTALSAEVTRLYERAAEVDVTEEKIRAACGRLSSLKKDALVQLAEGIGLHGMKAKKVSDIADAVTARLLDRKGAAVRGQLIERPASPSS